MNRKWQILNKEFTFFLVTRLLFTMGMKMVPVLLGWYLYEKTGSKMALGMLGLSEVIPAMLLALPAGVKADTSPKRALILKCLASYLIVTLAFALITSAWMSSLKMDYIIYTIYLLVGLTGFESLYFASIFSNSGTDRSSGFTCKSCLLL
ncbi:MAG: MFS transporter [Saprospiraceae bacterium]|nr:MFS transporter [Saprospiraceae bacterium]